MVGKRSDRLQERKHHTALPYLFAAAGWLLASATDHSHPIQLLRDRDGLGRLLYRRMAIFWTTPDQSISLEARGRGSR